MAREQLGICTEANLHGTYLLLNALEGHEQSLRYKLARLPQLFDRLAEHFSESLLTGVVAIGSNYWDILYPDARPAGLEAFPEVQADINLSPMPVDLFIQLRSDRQDVNFITCQQVLQLLHGHIEIQEYTQGFRYLDGRTLTGFPDAPLNPKGRQKRLAALIEPADQPVFSGGSYLYVQRLLFDNQRWQQMSVLQQEEIMGIYKVSGKPLPDGQQLPDCHLLTMYDTDADFPATLQQNMPFAQLKQQGLMQISYSANNEALQQQLFRRLGSNTQNGYDQLLNFYQIDFSAAFFAPSISFLELAAQHKR